MKMRSRHWTPEHSQAMNENRLARVPLDYHFIEVMFGGWEEWEQIALPVFAEDLANARIVSVEYSESWRAFMVTLCSPDFDPGLPGAQIKVLESDRILLRRVGESFERFPDVPFANFVEPIITAAADSLGLVAAKCGQCKGTGNHPDVEVCGECKGSGEVFVPA